MRSFKVGLEICELLHVLEIAALRRLHSNYKLLGRLILRHIVSLRGWQINLHLLLQEVLSHEGRPYEARKGVKGVVGAVSGEVLLSVIVLFFFNSWHERAFLK